jgi:hypothetical protein
MTLATADDRPLLAPSGASLRRRQRFVRRGVVHAAAARAAASTGSWDSVPFARVAACGRVTTSDVVEVRGKFYADGSPGAYLSGISTCGSVWACEVCSAKIRARRSDEIRVAGQRHLEACGQGGFVMLTLTMRHDDGDDLDVLLGALLGAWRSFQQSAVWREIRDGIVGTVRSVEITRTGRNGWHPHLHVMLFTGAGFDGRLRELLDTLGPRMWAERVERRLGKRPTDGVGFHTKDMSVRDLDYVSKMANEAARADLKSASRSVWQIIDAMGDGETWAVEAFTEYHAATKGLRAIQWSRGLRALYLPESVEERTDEELAADTEDGIVLDVLDARTYRRLARTPVAVVELLEGWEFVMGGCVLSSVWKPPPEGVQGVLIT